MPSAARLTEMKELVKAHYDAAMNEQDLTKLDEQLTEDFVDHSMPPGTPKGVGPVKEWLDHVRGAFPDLAVRTEDMVAEGDRVAVRAVWTGTHLGAFRTLSATGRSVRFEGMVFWRLEGERIAERWAQLDVSGLMEQLKEEAAE